GGRERGDGGSAPQARGESGGDRAARQLHGDPAGERGVRIAREVAARAVRRVEQEEREERVSAFVVGLTGQIGAGKSMVAGMLRELGAKVLDADALVRDEQVRGTVGYSACVQTCGTRVPGWA